MRIIAGEHRGRRLVGPTDDRTTRPITDRVKEALFARLTAMGLFGDFEAGAVADVFCGTGSLGLEALSRGARRCVFVDRDRSALSGLQENLEALSEVERGTVHRGDALAVARWAGAAGEPYGVVFLDPPFPLMTERPGDVAEALGRVAARALHPEGVVMLRTPSEVPAPAAAGLRRVRSDAYGGMSLHLYERVVAVAAEPDGAGPGVPESGD